MSASPIQFGLGLLTRYLVPNTNAASIPNPVITPDHSATEDGLAGANQSAGRPLHNSVVEDELKRRHKAICAGVDRRFVWLMLLQWVAAIALSLWLNPNTRPDSTGTPHPHLMTALAYGGLITLIPVVLARVLPGEPITRLTIAAMQMLMSSLLIHLTGGRTETHFHIFGSLVLLAFYLDFWVLLAASATVVLTHLFDDTFLPFGVHPMEILHFLELTGWVVFCDIFLLAGSLERLRALRREITLGAGIGISNHPRDSRDEQTARDATEPLFKSNRAIFPVKRAGRNDLLVHSPAMLTQQHERQQDERNLHRAIEKHEFQVHYQPIYHGDRTIAGLEALLRWHDPVRGFIPPSHFIPLAEETGLILKLGSFVLHEACRQATDWHRRGLLTGRIAVNVSSIELAREDFADDVILTLRRHYTPPEAIELEVTESALLEDFALAERHLRQLHRYGIRISIDDFGTGYSSLGRLRQLTLDTLKVDRIFVDGVASEGPDRTVVGHIIAMAHTLGMQVVAEGVETDSQLQALRSLQCDQLQGFFLSRPLDQAQTESLLVASRLAQHVPAGSSRAQGITEGVIPKT